MNRTTPTRPRRRNRRKPKPDTRMPIAVKCRGEIIEQTARSITIEEPDGTQRVLPKAHIEHLGYVDGVHEPQFRHGVEFDGMVVPIWLVVKVFNEKMDVVDLGKNTRRGRKGKKC